VRFVLVLRALCGKKKSEPRERSLVFPWFFTIKGKKDDTKDAKGSAKDTKV
jgi:hypothetical protein